MKKIVALFLTLSLVIGCACAFAEEETCTYTIFNETESFVEI